MQKELYFDISSEEKGGSLFRVVKSDGSTVFYYNHSLYDPLSDHIRVFEDYFDSFELFWQHLLQDSEWFYMHPLFVHPEQRARVRAALQKVDWGIHSDIRWQQSHQRQWKKVLEDPGRYYNPL